MSTNESVLRRAWSRASDVSRNHAVATRARDLVRAVLPVSLRARDTQEGAPREAVPPEVFLAELRRDVERHFAVCHPLLMRLVHVPFTRHDYRIFGLQHYSLVGTFTTYLELLLVKAPSSDQKSWIAKVLVDEYGEGSDGEDHAALYRSFLRATGSPEGEEYVTRLHQDVTGFVGEHLRICRDEPFLVGLGAVGPGHEWSITHMFPPIVRGLERAGFAGSPVLEDVFERSVRDTASRRELEDRTEIIDGARSLVRGVVDPEDPTGVYSDAPSIVLEALPATLDRYRASLRHPPDASFFTVKDAVREYGAGVASIPRARWVVLVEGATLAIDDDVLLEMKELADAPSPSVAPPGVFADDIQARVEAARRTCWVVPDEDPLWGTSELLGLPVQIKGDFDGYKTFRVHRLEKERGTPEALARWSEDLGRILATVHAGSERDFPGTVAAIAAAVDDADAFASEQADVAIAYADRVARDRALFTDALAALGPTLGLVPGEGDGLRPDARALIGSEDAP